MEKEIAVRVDGVSKKFKVYVDKGTTLKEKTLFRTRRSFEEREVLRDISLTIRKGESVGLIGRNGCGKSTLLKLINRIMYPDAGTVETRGKIAALIELGAGFHPDMTGRENIYTNAAIFGLSRKEIDGRLQEIIDFSELGDYIDNPVRTYSSGMYMRLAFAVAIHVDAEILLVDEILSVGDAVFQAKCLDKLREIKGKGTTIVIVSHSLGQIEQFCTRSIWIRDGHIERDGHPNDVHPAYLDYMGRQYSSVLAQEEPLDEPEISEEPEPCEDAEKVPAPPDEEGCGKQLPEELAASEEPAPAEVTEAAAEPATRWGSGDAVITDVYTTDSSGRRKNAFSVGEAMSIVMEYTVKKPLQRPVCGIGIFRNDGLQCYGTNTHIDRLPEVKLGESGKVICRLQRNLLLPGEYTIDAAIHTPNGFDYDYFRFAARFRMYSTISDIGVVRMEHEWCFKE